MRKKWYSMATIPLRICKAVTIYKSQGIDVGPNKVWEKVLVWLPIGRRRKNPGSEIVAFFRVSYITASEIGNPLHETDRMIIFKIGKGKSCDKHKHLKYYWVIIKLQQNITMLIR